MKKFLIKLAIFVLPLFCTFGVLESYIRNYKTIMEQKQMYLSQKSDSIEVLILGNSHAADGINPNLFSLNAVNAAQGSQSLYFDMEITKKYLAEMTRLKYVLISVDYHSLYFTHSTQRDFMYSRYYEIDYKENSSFKVYNSLLLDGYGLKDGLPLVGKEPRKTERGWVGYKTTNYSQLSKLFGKRRVQQFNMMIEENTHNKNEIIESLTVFIKLLKEINVTPILLTLPCHNNYINNLDAKIETQNALDIENMCRQNDVKYLNYLYEKLPDTCFYNVDHMNKNGAFFISKKINKEILLIEQSQMNENKS